MERRKRAKLNKDTVQGAKFATAGQYEILDTVRSGFYLKVGKGTKTFFFRREEPDADGIRKTVHYKLGRFPDVTCEAARARVDEMVGEVAGRKLRG